jgi:dienelactone hydrolase
MALPLLLATALDPRGADAQDRPAPAPLDQSIRRQAEEAPLRLRFQGGTAAETRAWQTAFKRKLQELLGPYQPPKAWQVVVERTVTLDDHRREELVLTAPGVPPLPVYLLLPTTGLAGRRPGIVAVHGHGPNGYDPVAGAPTPEAAAAAERSRYDYGRQLVRRGYVVAVPCLTPFGRRLGDRGGYGGNDPCAVTFVRLQLLGKLLIAENLRDVLWALELLARHKAVNADRLGCVGLSYGGRMTMLASALEPRIRVAVISGALNCFQERIASHYSCGAQVIPGLLQYGDVPEIAALIAPRPCLWEVGSKDALQPAPWVERALARLTPVYQALGAANRLEVARFDGGHRWDGARAYRLLSEVLNN